MPAQASGQWFITRTQELIPVIYSFILLDFTSTDQILSWLVICCRTSCKHSLSINRIITDQAPAYQLIYLPTDFTIIIAHLYSACQQGQQNWKLLMKQNALLAHIASCLAVCSRVYFAY